jgi:hypothetical protein
MHSTVKGPLFTCLLLLIGASSPGCDTPGIPTKDKESVAAATAAVAWLREPWLDTSVAVAVEEDVPHAVRGAITQMLGGARYGSVHIFL